jgi:TorA maturation chaperone TorD
MKLRERIGTIIHDEDFVALFAKDGALGLPPWRSLLTIGASLLQTELR